MAGGCLPTAASFCCARSRRGLGLPTGSPIVSSTGAIQMLLGVQIAKATHSCTGTADECACATEFAVTFCLDAADQAFEECAALFPELIEIICTPELNEAIADCADHKKVDFDFDTAVAAIIAEGTCTTRTCDDLAGAQAGLCNAYCTAMQCGTDNQNTSDKACDRVSVNFAKVGGDLPIPCP